MLREIKGAEKLYRIKRTNGSSIYVVTDNIKELARYCVTKEKGGYIISGISEIQIDGSTPRVAIRSTPEYKAAKKEILTFKEFRQTDVYKTADAIEAYDMDGKEIDIDWLESHSYHIVMDYHTDNKLLMIRVDAY